uniref:P-type domain-containing protein n=1 Tax=Periophthalmus magnuspinnatus TaxID=409849 RepID=A0A3B4AN37_9GOBI
MQKLCCSLLAENTNPIVPQCPNIPLAERVDCYPDAGASKQQCEARGCCWSPLDERNVPWCYFSTNHGYTVESVDQSNPNALKATLKRMAAPSLFGADIQELAFYAEMQTPKRLHFKISDAQNKRFEVPHEHIAGLNAQPSSPISDTMEITHSPFGITVRRKENMKVLFDTSMAPLVFADQYLQISAKLPSHNIYGLGEHVHQHFRHDTNWRTWPIFTRDAFPNGVTLQPAPAVTYRTIGGVLDFYIVFGDTPEQVVQEFLELIGRPVIPAYWSLGFQLSRWDYGSLSEVKATVERNRAVQIPYDIQYTDIDYMEDKKDFTYDKVKFAELPQFYDYLHDKGQRYILILDPAIATSKRVGNTSYDSYDRGTAKNAWVFEADGKTPLLGEVWPGETVFPDYTSQACIDWWVDEYERFSREIKHDALWIVSIS